MFGRDGVEVEVGDERERDGEDGGRGMVVDVDVDVVVVVVEEISLSDLQYSILSIHPHVEKTSSGICLLTYFLTYRVSILFT